MRKLLASEMNDLVNDCPKGTPLHSRYSDFIQMMTTWGEEVGHDKIAQIAGLIDMVYRSPLDRKKMAEFRKQECDLAGLDTPEIVSSIISSDARK